MNKFINIYIKLDGRLTRTQFWAYYLIPFVTIGYFLSLLEQSGYTLALDTFFIAVTWPSLAAQVKRWHDIDKSGWWTLIVLIPIIGGVGALIANGFWPGTKTRNKYDQPSE